MAQVGVRRKDFKMIHIGNAGYESALCGANACSFIADLPPRYRTRWELHGINEVNCPKCLANKGA